MAEKKVELVRMVRMPENVPEGEPTTADVHPDEVENFRRSGWFMPAAQPKADE